MIIIRPAYDRETRATHAIAGLIVPQLPLCRDLSGSQATRLNLQRTLQQNPTVTIVAFYGHGEKDRLFGHSLWNLVGRSLVRSEPTKLLPPEVVSRNVYAVACRAGVLLGPALARSGGRFIGYNDDFVLTIGFEAEFGAVVNDVLLALTQNWGSPNSCQAVLADAWNKLIDDFTYGAKSDIPRAFLVARDALVNREGVAAF